jgi:Tfp pilus assembly PilM family ATPase
MQLDRSHPGTLIAAAELSIPDSIRRSPDQALDFLGAELPGLLRAAGFKGKKVVTAIPGGKTYVQHLQVATSDGVSVDDIVKGQLQMQLNCSPTALVVRCIEVSDAKCRDAGRREVICFATSRDSVMRYVNTLRKCKLDITGMHTESMATIWAYQHLHPRDEADAATVYLNLGWSSSTVTISHGAKIVFARCIPIGGMHFDQQIAAQLKCELFDATTQRLMLQEQVDLSATEGSNGSMMNAEATGADGGASVATASPHATATVIPDLYHLPTTVDVNSITGRFEFGELLDTLTDEISMSLRYHRGLFPHHSIARTIVHGGEARQPWLAASVSRNLCDTVFVGNPLARFDRPKGLLAPGVAFNELQPGWTVACGLCHAPSDQ